MSRLVQTLKVPTKVAPSRISGRGLFAAAPIPRGVTVATWDPPIDSTYPPDHPDSLSSLSPSERRRFTSAASFDEDGWYMSGDDGVYVNHSDRPNVVAIPGDGPPATWDRVTSRPVGADEELTMDYGQIGGDVPRRRFDRRFVAEVILKEEESPHVMKITATQLRRIIREEAHKIGGGTAPVSAFYAAGPAEQADLKAKIADLATSTDFKGTLVASRLPPAFSRLKQSEFQTLWKNIDYPGYTRAAAYRKIPAVTEATLRRIVREEVAAAMADIDPDTTFCVFCGHEVEDDYCHDCGDYKGVTRFGDMEPSEQEYYRSNVL